MDASEQELVNRAVGCDEDAISALLQRHGPLVHAQIAAALGSKWQAVLDADDVMQVTYLEAFLRIDRFQPRGNGSFAGWLAQIAKNNMRDAIDELSRQKRPQPDRRIESSGDSTVDLIDKLGVTTTTPSQHAATQEMRQAVTDAIDHLPDDYAGVVRMYDLDGKSAADIGREMGRTEGAVYMLRARAHDRLRETFSSAAGLSVRPA